MLICSSSRSGMKKTACDKSLMLLPKMKIMRLKSSIGGILGIVAIGAQVSLTYKVEETTANGNTHRVTKTLDGTVDVVRYVYGLTAEDDYVIVTIYRD